MNEIERAWLAGLYEGEGTAYARVSNRNGWISTSVRVCICMTDLDIIERVQTLFPSPSGIHTRRRKKTYKPQHEWRISQRDEVARFLRLVLPFLGERRTEQALGVLAYAEDPNGGLGSGHRKKTHCPNGHEYTRENSRSNSGHKTLRRCRTCERNYRRRKATEKRANSL